MTSTHASRPVRGTTLVDNLGRTLFVSLVQQNRHTGEVWVYVRDADRPAERVEFIVEVSEWESFLDEHVAPEPAAEKPAAPVAAFYLRRVVHLAAVIDGTPADHALCGMNLQYGAIDTTADATCADCRRVADRLAAATPADEPAALEVPEYLRPALDAYGAALDAHGQTYGSTPACECGREFGTRNGVGLHIAAAHKRAEREYTAAAAIARNRHNPTALQAAARTVEEPLHNEGDPIEDATGEFLGSTSGVWTPADAEHAAVLGGYGLPAARAQEAARPVHFAREYIAARFREVDEFVLQLGPDDTAYDPETGDTLLGGVRVRYARGTFPGPTYTATILDREPELPADTDADDDALGWLLDTARTVEPGPEVDDPREEPAPLEWSEVAAPSLTRPAARPRALRY